MVGTGSFPPHVTRPGAGRCMYHISRGTVGIITVVRRFSLTTVPMLAGSLVTTRNLASVLIGGLMLIQAKSPYTPRFIYDGRGQLVGRIDRVPGNKEFVYDRQGKLQYKVDVPKDQDNNKKKR